MKARVGVVLVNLGTPDSPAPKDVHKYLIEFLTDGRVIDIPWPLRQLLVRGLIVPRRYKASARSYKEIWTEEGSPLMVYGRKVRALLQERMGDEFLIEIAMRYQNPSIAAVLEKMKEQRVSHLVVLPLFPQYASATTGSVHQRVVEEIQSWNVVPECILVNHYPTHPKMIEAFCAKARRYPLEEYDRILFSFHGLPERHLRKADPSGYCLSTPDCCQRLHEGNRDCYSAQCYATAQAIAQGLQLPKEKYRICFQSRLGKDPWIQPYTSEVIHQMAEEGVRKVLVMCPAFVCDCLETIFEIGVEYQEEFQEKGGEKLDLVEGLNDDPLWIEALEHILREHLPQHAVTQ